MVIINFLKLTIVLLKFWNYKKISQKNIARIARIAKF